MTLKSFAQTGFLLSLTLTVMGGLSCGDFGGVSAPPSDPAPVTVPYEPDSATVVLRCGRLIDGRAEESREGVTILIEHGVIGALGPDVQVPPTVPWIDLSQLTCLPGLIDMHTHLTDSSGDTADLRVFFDRSDEEQRRISRENAEKTIRAGFTSVRNVGTYIGWADNDIRDEINQGRALGPRIQAAGFYLTIPGGGGDLLIPGVAEKDIPARVRMGVARGAAAFRAKAEEAIAGGADVLKVIASGAVLAYGGVPGEPEMTKDEIAAVVEVAHRAGKKVAAHAHGARSIKEAILAGADTIEHASLIDEEGIELAKKHQVALSMDVYNGDYIERQGRLEHWPEEFLIKNMELTEVQRRNFTKAYRAGVAMVYGTDSAVYPHGDNALQFAIMVERGMTPMDAIRSATSVAAHYMGWGEKVGTLAAGFMGDVIAVQGDPLGDIEVLQKVEVVFKGGLLVNDRRSLPLGAIR